MRNLEHHAARALLSFVLVSITLLGSGCFNRQLLRFRSHETKPVILMETIDSTSYVFWRDDEHVFWSCAEANDTLECTRRCGKGSDLDCPAVSIFTDGVGTNTR